LHFTSQGKNSAPFYLAFVSSLAMQDVHGARLYRRGEAGCCAHAQQPPDVGWAHGSWAEAGPT